MHPAIVAMLAVYVQLLCCKTRHVMCTMLGQFLKVLCWVVYTGCNTCSRESVMLKPPPAAVYRRLSLGRVSGLHACSVGSTSIKTAAPSGNSGSSGTLPLRGHLPRFSAQGQCSKLPQAAALCWLWHGSRACGGHAQHLCCCTSFPPFLLQHMCCRLKMTACCNLCI